MGDHFNWLHLTDVHFGQSKQAVFWPNVRKAFFEDLKRLHERCGPWHAVLFTGDLVFSGAGKEFKGLEKELLGPLWEELGRLGSGSALLLAVPGNHDLARPAKKTAAVHMLLRKDCLAEIEEEFWSAPRGEYRKIVDKVFSGYTQWWKKRTRRQSKIIRNGLLPGDFAATLPIGARRIGIIGLNTSFLQLSGGDFRQRLAWDLQQFQAVCPDPHQWKAEHDACLLLTHHGPGWLTERISPDRPTSPKKAMSWGRGKFLRDETTAMTTPKSTAGSSIDIPPATLR